MTTNVAHRRRFIRHRLARRRVAALQASGAGGARDARRPTWDPLVGITRSVCWVLDGLGVPPGERSGSDDRSSDRARGAAIVVAGLLVTTVPAVALFVGVVGWHLPRLIAAQRRRRTVAALVDETLFATELCGVSVHTGATIPQAVDAVWPHLGGRLGTSLRRAAADHHDGMLLDECLSSVTTELGDVVAPLITVLRAAHVDGDPVEPALARLADRMREDRRRMIETEVRRLSVRLLIPLVCCSLPGFVLIAVVPLALGPLGSPGH